MVKRLKPSNPPESNNQLSIEWWPIERLKPYERNARNIPEAAVHKVAASIRLYGWRQPIVAEQNGTIVIGHVRRLAAIENKDALVPVHVAHGLSAAQLKALRIADNRTHDETTWNEDLLKMELRELEECDFDVPEMTGFDFEEVQKLLAFRAAETEEDDVPPTPPIPVTQAGDLWNCGEHKLVCGDCTDADIVSRLLGHFRLRPTCSITDPPYNVGFSYGDQVDDGKSAAAYVSWTRQWFALARNAVSSCVVLTSGIINLPMWIGDIERTHRIISWVKENQCSRNDIGTTSGFNVWEPILVYGKAKKCVARDSFSIPIHIQPDVGDHPCPKSIKAWSWLVEAFSDPGDLLFEPFSGSGTTMIACTKMNRICAAIEIEPRWVDVGVERWQNLSGNKATLEGDGRTFEEITAERRPVVVSQ